MKKLGVKIVALGVAAMLVVSPVKAEAVEFGKALLWAAGITGVAAVTGGVVGYFVNKKNKREINKLKDEREGALNAFNVPQAQRANANLASVAGCSMNTLQHENGRLRKENTYLKGERQSALSAFNVPLNEERSVKLAHLVGDLQFDSQNLQQDNKALKNSNSTLQEKYSDMQNENFVLKSENSRLTQKNADMEKGANEDLQNETENLRKENITLQKNFSVLQNETAVLKSSNENLTQITEVQQQESAKLLMENEDLQNERRGVLKVLGAPPGQAEIVDLANLVEDLKNHDANMASQNANLQRENEALKRKANATLRSENAALTKANAELKEHTVALMNENMAMKVSNANLTNERRDMLKLFEIPPDQAENAKLANIVITTLINRASNRENENPEDIITYAALAEATKGLVKINGDLTKAKSDLKNENVTLTKSNDSLKTLNARLMKDRQGMLKDLNLTQQASKDMEKENAALKNRPAGIPSDLQQRLEDLQKENKALQTRFSDLRRGVMEVLEVPREEEDSVDIVDLVRNFKKQIQTMPKLEEKLGLKEPEIDD